LNLIPEVFRHNGQFWGRKPFALAFRARPAPALIGTRYLHKLRAIPNNFALVKFSLQYRPNRCGAPRSTITRSGAGGRKASLIQTFRYFLERYGRSEQFENLFDYHSFSLVNYQRFGLALPDCHCIVAVATASRVRLRIGSNVAAATTKPWTPLHWLPSPALPLPNRLRRSTRLRTGHNFMRRAGNFIVSSLCSQAIQGTGTT